MTEEKKQEIRQKMNTVSKDAKKIRETLCGVYVYYKLENGKFIEVK